MNVTRRQNEPREHYGQHLADRLNSREATIGVIGLGYVGLPLAVAFASAGFRVVGVDVERSRVESLQKGQSYIVDVRDEDVAAAVQSGRLAPVSDYALLAAADAVCICVPTPLRKSKDPDISYIRDAVNNLNPFVHPGMLIVLESTTYPGTTEELIGPALIERGLLVGRDVFICFSPERIDPGNKRFGLRNTPKVVGGCTPRCTEIGTLLYRTIAERVVPVSSCRVAEMVKLLENTFRSVNIALVNEMALMCERMGLDVWEVIDAAATKPFGFMPFYPGPGIGGHCIPLDPHYLAWKARSFGFYNRFIDLASDINGNMPLHTVARVAELLNIHGKCLKGSRILLVGLAYKRDVNDTRESPAVEILQLLLKQGARVNYHDPHVPVFRLGGRELRSIPLAPRFLRTQDCVVMTADHSSVDYSVIVAYARLIYDTRNALGGITAPHVARLGAPLPRAVNPLFYREKVESRHRSLRKVRDKKPAGARGVWPVGGGDLSR